MPFCEIIQLEVPQNFPLEAYQSFIRAVRDTIPTHLESYREFGGASNLIAWRFRACIEYKDAYLDSSGRFGVAS